MFQIFWEEPIITVAILGFWLFSLLVRILLGMLYRSMIRESDNMATTNNRLLRQCKLKFANCYQLNNGVSNIPVFVDKFLNRLSLGPFSFETLYHLSGQSMLLSMIFAGVGVCRAIMHGHTVGDILPFYIVSFLGLYLYFSVSSMVNLKGKKRILKVNLVDYLENHLSARIGVTENDLEMLYGNENVIGRRRKLELMPIGNRGTVGMEIPVGNRSVVGMEIPAGNRSAMGVDMPYGNRSVVGMEMPVGNQSTTNAEMQMDAPLPATNQPNPFRISEEEWEALIKEFC